MHYTWQNKIFPFLDSVTERPHFFSADRLQCLIMEGTKYFQDFLLVLQFFDCYVQLEHIC